MERTQCLPYKRGLEISFALPVHTTEGRHLGCHLLSASTATVYRRHCLPPQSATTAAVVYRHRLPSQSAAVIYRCSLPPSAITDGHHRLLLPFAAAAVICRCRLLLLLAAACCCLPLFVVTVLFVGLVPTIMKGNGIAAENSTMVASRRGRSDHGTRGMSRNGKSGRGKLICSHCGKEGHLQNRCYDIIGWPNKTANISSSDIPSNERTGFQLISDEEYQEYQEFLRFKSNNHAQSSASPSVSTTCISHSMGNQGPWIIDSGASDHISGNDSVFSSISSPKFPHFISLANGSKM
ncbi:hypothetical protein CR513_22940, partial [Mucuna pruriens]